MKKNSLYDIFKIIVYTIVPFLLPFLFNIDNSVISILGKWIIFGVCLLLDIVCLICIFIQEKKLEVKKAEENKKTLENEFIRYAYSNIFDINTIKRNYYIKKSYDLEYNLANEFPYDSYDYIAELCKSFTNIISRVTNTQKENISVSFIYRFSYETASDFEKEWKWIIGKELTMDISINEYIKSGGSLYNYLIDNKKIALFCNDKQEWSNKELYKMSARDERHDQIGSFFASKVAFGNNNNALPFCEGIIMVSTYGKKFVDENDKGKVDDFRKLIIDSIFPCYQSMLEMELGVLYFKNKKTI